jgi:hypothetical protein
VPERVPARPAPVANGVTPSPANGTTTAPATNAANGRPNTPDTRNDALTPGTKPGDVLSGLIR